MSLRGTTDGQGDIVIIMQDTIFYPSLLFTLILPIIYISCLNFYWIQSRKTISLKRSSKLNYKILEQVALLLVKICTWYNINLLAPYFNK